MKEEKIRYRKIEITICEPCLKGSGEMCDSPECALFLNKVDLPITEEIYHTRKIWDSDTNGYYKEVAFFINEDLEVVVDEE